MKSGDPTYDGLQDELKAAKVSGDEERISQAEEAIRQYARLQTTRAQQAYMTKFHAGLSQS